MDLSLMVAVPHRQYNRRHFNRENFIHAANACCENLLEDAINGKYNGKTLLFVPCVAVESEGVSLELYENWLNCLKCTGMKWKHSTLDKWYSLSSWNSHWGTDEYARRCRFGIRERSGEIDFKYWDATDALRETINEFGERCFWWYRDTTDSKEKHVYLGWDEPGYLIEVNFKANKVEGEHRRVSIINQMARFPYFTGSYMENKGWFMQLWDEQLFNNSNLDDWAKISLSFLLMPDIDLEMQNDYFIPFSKNETDLFPNTLENFMRTGEGNNLSLSNPYIQQGLPWAEYNTIGKTVKLEPKHLKEALLSDKRNHDMAEFIEVIKETQKFAHNMGYRIINPYTKVGKTALDTLIKFIEQHTKLGVRHDKELEIGSRPGIPTKKELKELAVRFIGGTDPGEQETSSEHRERVFSTRGLYSGGV
jgi:hypothetical protein